MEYLNEYFFDDGSVNLFKLLLDFQKQPVIHNQVGANAPPPPPRPPLVKNKRGRFSAPTPLSPKSLEKKRRKQQSSIRKFYRVVDSKEKRSSQLGVESYWRKNDVGNFGGGNNDEKGFPFWFEEDSGRHFGGMKSFETIKREVHRWAFTSSSGEDGHKSAFRYPKDDNFPLSVRQAERMEELHGRQIENLQEVMRGHKLQTSSYLRKPDLDPFKQKEENEKQNDPSLLFVNGVVQKCEENNYSCLIEATFV